MKDDLKLGNFSPLPDLPRKLNKREAKITPSVMKWFMKNHPSNVALEIKATKSNTIARSAVKDHQLKALLAVRSKEGLSYKIPDTGHVRLPFDCFQLRNTNSYVVACFPAKGVCFAIHPEKWDGFNINKDTDYEFRIKL